jgi:hypothetical protein
MYKPKNKATLYYIIGGILLAVALLQFVGPAWAKPLNWLKKLTGTNQSYTVNQMANTAKTSTNTKAQKTL